MEGKPAIVEVCLVDGRWVGGKYRTHHREASRVLQRRVERETPGLIGNSCGVRVEAEDVLHDIDASVPHSVVKRQFAPPGGFRDRCRISLHESLYRLHPTPT